jgi:hypothetical protein
MSVSKLSTPQNAFTRDAQLHDYLSAIVVIFVTVLALLLGWGLKNGVQNRARLVQIDGISADVPLGWLVQEGAGDLAFQARNPNAPSHLYNVRILQPTGDLAGLAQAQSLLRGRFSETYRVLDETRIVFAGKNGYRVHYAYVNVRATGMPAIIEGTTYYLPSGGKTIVTSYENTEPMYTDGLTQFQNFLETVTFGGGQ